MHDLFRTFCILHCALCIAGCSIPNLEDPACTEARTAVREFYSFHFGNDLAFAGDDLEKRKDFLTPAFFESLRYRARDVPSGVDPFTRTDDLPKAFRVGECREISSDKAEFQVVLFWRDDVRSDQREIKVVAVKQNEKWLLDEIKN
ncbi:MAG TPA: hypothetical protein VJ781_03660 [Pyrinomonadaceae bacterium]|jgi:hypothetical protein|nr:hypothetical protein [Pyrinomonadaceae bacterium]